MQTTNYAIPEKLKKTNQQINFHRIDGKDFKPYGQILNIDAADLIILADKTTSIKPAGNTYEAVEPVLQKHFLYKEFALFFGSPSIQIGYCNGKNQYLNSMEYHKSPEIFIAVTDCIQFITAFKHLHNFSKIDTKYTKAFYFPKGSVSAIAPYVLHFSPCAVYKSGFKSVIILPEGTNKNLCPQLTEFCKNSTEKESQLLLAQNKWLITHTDNIRMVERGAFIGVNGSNLHIEPID